MLLNELKDLAKDEEGFGTVEIVLIIAVLVGIALIFRDAVIKFAVSIMQTVFGDDSISKDIRSGGIRDSYRID